MTLTTLPAHSCSHSHFTDVDTEPQSRSARLSHAVTGNSIKPLQTPADPRLQPVNGSTDPWLWGKPVASLPPTSLPGASGRRLLHVSQVSTPSRWCHAGAGPTSAPTSSPRNTCGPLAGLCLCSPSAARGSFPEQESDPSPPHSLQPSCSQRKVPEPHPRAGLPRVALISSPGLSPHSRPLSCFRHRVLLPLCRTRRGYSRSGYSCHRAFEQRRFAYTHSWLSPGQFSQPWLPTLANAALRSPHWAGLST